MKKIFAIALALVMVLSMASAFAWCPAGFDWNCTTDVCANGKGKVEVIPYVKGNGCEDGNTWTANTCAGAVNGDLVYFALKLTVDADPNLDWWDDATLAVTPTDVTVKYGSAAPFDTGAELVAGVKALDTKGNEFKAGEYYLTADGKFVKAADFKANATTLFNAEVDVASSAKVCATLASKLTVTTAGVEINNKYIVKFDGTNLGIIDKKDNTKSAVFYVVDEKIKTIAYDGKVLVSFDGAKFMDSAANTYGVSCEPWAWLYNAMTYFGINFGTCINQKTVDANLGWDDEFKACTTWSANVQAVVDAECVVAIPKTGDASVLAWLF